MGYINNYIRQLHHNLNKYDVIVGLEIPDFRTVTYYLQFLQILNILESGMMNSTQTLKCYMRHVFEFG